MLTKKFIARLMRERFIDTRNYRYFIDYNPCGYTVKRVPIDALDTTRVYSETENVYIKRLDNYSM